ncbi:MAG: hypothetical protein ACYTEZ_00925 [Planctomycetota bacterium]|jgi:hypothetical protein
MRKDLLAAALGFLIGAAALAGGEEDDWELSERLQKLQEAIARLRQEARPAADRLPPLGPKGQELELFAVYDLTSGRHDFLPPEHALQVQGEREGLFGAVSDEAPQPLGTIEELMELVRSHVWASSYEEGAMISAEGQTLVVVNSRAALADTAGFLDRLRDRVHRCVTVEAQVVDLAPALSRRLGEGRGTSLTPEQQGELATALADGKASLIFAGRTTGFVGQRSLLWHGRQVALASEADVQVAEGQAGWDPRVEVVQAGGYLSVRPSAGDEGARITLDVELRWDELEALESRDTDAGSVDLPRIRATGATTTLTVDNRTWALLGGGVREGGKVRALLVRATHLPRTGGAR